MSFYCPYQVTTSYSCYVCSDSKWMHMMAGNSHRIFPYHVGAISRREIQYRANTAPFKKKSLNNAIYQFLQCIFFFSPQLTKNTFFRNHDQSPCGGDKRILVMPQCNLPDRPLSSAVFKLSPLLAVAPSEIPRFPLRFPLPPSPSPLSPPPRRSIMASLFYLDRWKQLTGNQTLKIELIFWIVLFYSYFH